MDQNQEKKQRHGCNIAVIGGGFSGTILAAQLVHGADSALSVVLIERQPFLGRGVAYCDRKSGKPERLNVDWVLNCTGPELNCT